MANHCKSLRFSRVQEAESLEGNYLDGELYAQLNVTLTQHKFWRSDKTMEFSSLSRFGLTCKPLTEDDGEDLLMLYLEDSRVKTLVAQEKEQELPERVQECGRTWRGSLAKYDHVTHSLKTAQCSLLEDSESFLATLPRWGTMRSGDVYQQPIVALHMREIESGLLLATPTATANQLAPSMMKHPGCRNMQPDGITFHHTPNTTGMDGGSNSQSVSTESGQLNPNWVEWLMGWPIGWTDLKQLGMDRFHEWQQQHSQFYGGD
jgi:hypothetical protein